MAGYDATVTTYDSIVEETRRGGAKSSESRVALSAAISG